MNRPRIDGPGGPRPAQERADADLQKEAEEAPRIEAAEAEAAASILLRAYGEWKDHKFPLCHESRSNYEKVLMRAGPALARYVLATRPRPAPQPATGEGPFSSDEALARFFHDTYERLAPSFGYETRPETRTFDPASKNGRLMLAVMREVRTVLAAEDRAFAGRLLDAHAGARPATGEPAPQDAVRTAAEVGEKGAVV